MHKKYLLIPAVGIALTAGQVLNPKLINAQDDTGNSMQSLIQKLTSRFNLNESDVQAVFNEHQTERQQQLQANFETRLNKLVAEGKITAAQKDVIIAKHKELQAKHLNDWQNKQNLTPEEWRIQKESQRQELEAWAKQNNVDLKYLMFGGRGHGMGMRGWK